VKEAAEMLGISTGAVRNRLSRGTLASAKEKGVVYVLLPVDMSRDAGRDTDDMSAEMSQPDSGALISEMHDRLRYVEGQLEAERQAHAEARRLLMAALERIPPQLEAPSETRESSVPASEATDKAAEEPRSAAGVAQEGAQRPQERSWWRRVFGR
jgi:DNA-binding Lrp family transcriptional regulator